MKTLIGQYALAGLLGVLLRAGQIISDDLVGHLGIDWPVVLGEAIKTCLPLLVSLSVAMHLNDLGSARAARAIRAKMKSQEPVHDSG